MGNPDTPNNPHNSNNPHGDSNDGGSRRPNRPPNQRGGYQGGNQGGGHQGGGYQGGNQGGGYQGGNQGGYQGGNQGGGYQGGNQGGGGGYGAPRNPNDRSQGGHQGGGYGGGYNNPRPPQSPRPPRSGGGPPQFGGGGRPPYPPRPPQFGGGRPQRPMGGRPGGFQGGRDDRNENRTRPPKAKIIFRDSFVMAIYKPAGIPVKGTNSPTLIESVDEIAAARRSRMRVAHDIDALASGIVLFAETRKSEDTPRQQTHPETTYIVLVEGVFEGDDKKSGKNINAPVSKWTGQGATPATNMRVLDSGNGLSILQVRARPDLPGQVREHLALVGHPVVGDRQNGATRDDLRRLGMHAAEVRLIHPEEDKRARYKCPTPISFWRALGKEPPLGVIGSVDLEEEKNLEDAKGWDHVAGWYDDLITERGSVHHETLIVPGVTRMLDLQKGERLLDIACGQGVLCEHLAKSTAADEFVGVDLSPALIEKATERSTDRTRYLVGDVEKLSELDLGSFDAASCVMAMMNFDNIEPVFEGIAGSLRPGGRFACVILHPAFRITANSSWGWANDERTREPVQFRRVDQYMSNQSQEIVMNPGQVARGKPAITTVTHHRPMSRYINAMCKAGLLVESIEEWTSKKISEPGPRAIAENLARREIPLFMAIHAVLPSSD